MERLAVKYLGLNLRSPLIISSSRLTSTIDNLSLAEEHGAGAVVLKSLFEEQIIYQLNSLAGSSDYPEADDYISYYTKSQSVDEYLKLIKEAKEKLSIPVIASINCFSSSGWTDFTKKISEFGADAIEINMFFMPHDRKISSTDSEEIYFDLIEKIKESAKIPIALKIGFRFSNILYMIDQFYMRGIDGVVMFNRFYEPDIDINRQEIIAAPVFSDPCERRYTLRWIAMASALDINIDISASTGVHSGEDAVRYLLAGADSVQVCSVLYQKGIQFISRMNKQVEEWMVRNDYKSIDDFKGRLNWFNYKNPSVLERTQFMKYFSSEE